MSLAFCTGSSGCRLSSAPIAPPTIVPLPGQVWGLAAPDAAGPLYATSYAGEDLSTTVLTALDPSGTVMWQRTFPGHPSPPRVSDRATVWIAHREPGNASLRELDANGSVLTTIVPDHEPHERLGAFVLLPDGILVTWLPADFAHVIEPGRIPRVARYDHTATCLWSTPITLDWNPPTIEVSHWEPLLVSGNRTAATLEAYSSGIGVTHLLDTTTGEIIATTRPGPSGYKAITGPEQFLIGQQGYGTFTTATYTPNGQIAQAWPTHVMPLIDHHGTIRGPESENVLPSRSRFRALLPNGTLRDGPPLSGYYTTYPALDHHGTTIFWRNSTLLTIDADFHLRKLFTMPDDRAVMSRILLLNQGQITFALHSDLLLFPNTGLAPLNPGIWPCGNGNLANNPVTHP